MSAMRASMICKTPSFVAKKNGEYPAAQTRFSALLRSAPVPGRNDAGRTEGLDFFERVLNVHTSAPEDGRTPQTSIPSGA